MRVCVCVCVCERERERERATRVKSTERENDSGLTSLKIQHRHIMPNGVNTAHLRLHQAYDMFTPSKSISRKMYNVLRKEKI